MGENSSVTEMDKYRWNGNGNVYKSKVQTDDSANGFQALGKRPVQRNHWCGQTAKCNIKEDGGPHVWKVLHKTRSPHRLFCSSADFNDEGGREVWGQSQGWRVSSQMLLYVLHTPMRTCRDTHGVSVEIRWELQINTQLQSACVWLIAAHRKLFIEPITLRG